MIKINVKIFVIITFFFLISCYTIDYTNEVISIDKNKLEEEKVSEEQVVEEKSTPEEDIHIKVDLEDIEPLFKGEVYTELKKHTFSTIGDDIWVCVSNDGKLMIYSSTERSETPDVYIKSVNGAVNAQKTFTEANDIHSVFSPDGRRIAFASNKMGNYDIFVMDVSRSNVIQQITSSTSSDEIHPSWSADGKKLVFCSRKKDGSSEWSMWIYNFETNERVNLGPGFLPVYSPVADKTNENYGKIAFQRTKQKGDTKFSIWTVKEDGRELVEIVNSEKWSAEHPSWSPDGQYITFASSKGECDMVTGFCEADDIWIVKLDGTAMWQVTDRKENDLAPFWASDGRIYFSSNRDGNYNIWSLKPSFIEEKSAETEEKSAETKE